MGSDFRWIGQSEDASQVVLKRFEGRFDFRSEGNLPDDVIRTAVALDVETTGLHASTDEIIEIGLRKFKFDRESGNILEVVEGFSALGDPGRPLPLPIQRLTGLTDEQLAGKQIDWDAVGDYIAEADILLAHNAGFDRPFVDKKVKVSQTKIWGCSVRHVPWERFGFGTSKLALLCHYHGFYVDAHRALNDVDGLLHLLSFSSPLQEENYFKLLLDNARKPLVKVIAAHSPFESKDLLKARRYRWNTTNRVWMRSIDKEDLQEEIAWLEAAVYQGAFRGTSVEIPLVDNFKER